MWSPFTFYPFAFLLTLAWDRGNLCKDQIAGQDPDKGRKRLLITRDWIWHSSWSSLPRCRSPCPTADVPAPLQICLPHCRSPAPLQISLALCWLLWVPQQCRVEPPAGPGWQWVSGVACKVPVMTTLGQFQLQEVVKVVLTMQN